MESLWVRWCIMRAILVEINTGWHTTEPECTENVSYSGHQRVYSGLPKSCMQYTITRLPTPLLACIRLRSCGVPTNVNANHFISVSVTAVSRRTVRLLTHVLCKPTHFFFHSFRATMSYSLQTSFNSVIKGWADKFHVWGTPTRSSSRSHLR